MGQRQAEGRGGRVLKRHKIAVIHGPNLNLLGEREPEIYGRMTLRELDRALHALARRLDVSLTSYQSNHEGALIDRIQRLRPSHHGIIINAGAYSHTSIALRDALAFSSLPFIEVHLSPILRREPFRHQSVFSDLALGMISGLGPGGYLLALRALTNYLREREGRSPQW